MWKRLACSRDLVIGINDPHLSLEWQSWSTTKVIRCFLWPNTNRCCLLIECYPIRSQCFELCCCDTLSHSRQTENATLSHNLHHLIIIAMHSPFGAHVRLTALRDWQFLQSPKTHNIISNFRHKCSDFSTMQWLKRGEPGGSAPTPAPIWAPCNQQ